MKIAAICLVFVIFLSGCTRTVIKENSSTWTVEYTKKEAEISTEDGILIKGSYYLPKGAGTYPAVILVHDNGSDQSHLSWMVPFLIRQNYLVLAYDIRGMGKSVMLANGSEYKRNGLNYYDFMHLDLQGAVGFLKGQDEFDGRAGAIGVGLGGNIVFVTKGIEPGLKTGVVVSPSGGYLNDPHGAAGLFFLSDGSDGAMSLYNLTAEPKKIEIYKKGDSEQSVLNSKGALDDVLEWLSKTL